MMRFECEKRILWMTILVGGGMLFSVVVRAQTSGATLEGSVRDPAGAVVAEAHIIVRHMATNRRLETVTNENGLYRLGPMPPGSYQVRVEAPGFQPLVVDDVTLTVGQTATLDLTLQVEALTEELEVHAEMPLVEPTKTELSAIIDQTRINDLPISGRRFTDFALLTPSVTLGRSITPGANGPFQEQVTKVSFGGLAENHSNYFALDGADHNISVSGFQHLTPSQEAVQEFRVIQYNYSAEYGRAMGGIVNIVTKSGTNEFHGSVYEFFRNDALDARSILSAPGFNVLRQNQFGFTVGGPLIGDRFFFFGNYEGQRRAQSPVYNRFLLDNLDAINAVKASIGLSPENLRQLRVNDYDQFLVKLDGSLTPKTHAMLRYNFVDQDNRNQPGAPGNFGAPSTFRTNPIRDQSIVFNAVTTLSSSVVNEALFQYSRRSFHFDAVIAEPHLEIPNLFSLGRQIGPADFYRETRWQWADTVSVLRGSHGLKLGADVNHIGDILTWAITMNGFAIFQPENFFRTPPLPTIFMIGVPRALRGQPFQRPVDWTILFPSEEFARAAEIDYAHDTFDGFFQDSYRLSPSFTLNFGLRYFVETRGRFSYDNDYNNVQPRFGFAYRLGESGRGVLRGGFGIFHGILPWFILMDSNVQGGRLDDSDVIFSADLVGDNPKGVTVGPLPGPLSQLSFLNFITKGEYPTIALIQHLFGRAVRDWVNPYAEQGSLQLDIQIRRDWKVGLNYLWVHGLKLPLSSQRNAFFVGRAPNGKAQYIPADLRFGFYQASSQSNTSIYHGGTLSVEKHFTHHFSLTAHYTYSKTIDLVSALSFKDLAEDPMNFRLNRGPSNQHLGHRFVLTFLGETPERGVLRNFKFGVIATLESARRFTLFSGLDTNGDLEPGPDRVGIIGKNTYQGDDFRSVDLRVARVIRFHEGVRAELIAEFFNLFNTVNVTEVNTVYGAVDFLPGLPVPRRFGDGIPGAIPSFGTPAQVGNPRQIQFAIRLTF